MPAKTRQFESSRKPTYRLNLNEIFNIPHVEMKLYETTMEIMFEIENALNKAFDDIQFTFNRFCINNVNNYSIAYPLLVNLTNKTDKDNYYFDLSKIYDLIKCIPILKVPKQINGILGTLNLKNVIQQCKISNIEEYQNKSNEYINSIRSNYQTSSNDLTNSNISNNSTKSTCTNNSNNTINTTEKSTETNELINTIEIDPKTIEYIKELLTKYEFKFDCNDNYISIYSNDESSENYNKADTFIITNPNFMFENVDELVKMRNIIKLNILLFKCDSKYICNDDNKVISIGTFLKFRGKDINNSAYFALLQQCTKCDTVSIVNYFEFKNRCINCNCIVK